MTTRPAVSIVLPTFNRAAMLAQGLQSIAAQSFRDWELIVVDDGSTDRNREVVEEFRDRVSQPVTYIYQENQGPGVARQRALDEVGGELIALMDSDDPWFPQHLSDCVEALRQNPDVDWVVGPSRVVNELTGDVIHENSYFPDGAPLPFLKLLSEQRGKLSVIRSEDLFDYVVTTDLPGGLQASVFRRWIRDRVRFRKYRLFDDVVFQVEAVACGARVAYFQEPQITYRIHDQNVSLVNAARQTFDKRVAVFKDGVAIFEDVLRSRPLSPRQRRALKRRLAVMWFWDLGYNSYFVNGRTDEAFAAFRRALGFRPFDLRLWKSYWAQYARCLISPGKAGPRSLPPPQIA